MRGSPLTTSSPVHQNRRLPVVNNCVTAQATRRIRDFVCSTHQHNHPGYHRPRLELSPFLRVKIPNNIGTAMQAADVRVKLLQTNRRGSAQRMIQFFKCRSRLQSRLRSGLKSTTCRKSEIHSHCVTHTPGACRSTESCKLGRARSRVLDNIRNHERLDWPTKILDGQSRQTND